MDQAHTSMLNDHSLIMGNELAPTTRTSVRVRMANITFSLTVHNSSKNNDTMPITAVFLIEALQYANSLSFKK